jgi:2-methylcitrate dehydratase PrpD
VQWKNACLDGSVLNVGLPMSEGDGADGTTRAIARDGTALIFSALPDDVVELALQSILDTLAVALAGSKAEEVGIVLALVREDGNAAQASVIGHGTKLTPKQAALVNGISAHALDFDDCNLTMQGHASAVVLPAVLALGEHYRSSGRDLLTAFVAGVEAGCRVGAAMAPGHYDRGFHATGTHGTIAAAAAAARLLELDPIRTAHAISLAATMAAGLKSQFGTMAKPIHAGRAAENGLFAALLARAGVKARLDAIEAHQGYAATHAPVFQPEAAIDGPPKRFHIRDNLFKFHAACYGTQGVIQAATDVRAQEGFLADKIETIEIEAAVENEHTCAVAHPQTTAEARFSMHQAVAMGLLGIDTADPRAFDPTTATTDLQHLRERTAIRFVNGWHIAESRVTVFDRDGRKWSATAHAGQPGVDLLRQRKRLVAKFKSLVEPIAGMEQSARLLASIADLPHLRNVAVLAEASSGPLRSSDT